MKAIVLRAHGGPDKADLLAVVGHIPLEDRAAVGKVVLEL